MKKNLILTLILALLSSSLFAQQVIERSGMRILDLKRSTDNGQANKFEFKISDNLNGTNVLTPRSLSIRAAERYGDIALTASPYTKNPHFVVKYNGKVGIGINNPKERLHVDGRMLLDAPAGAAITIDGGTDNQYIEYETRGNTKARVGLDANGNFNIRKFEGGGIRLVGSNVYCTNNLSIGTDVPTARLTVAGGIHAREVRVTANAGADFVFEKDYALRPLMEVETFIQKNKHLPEIAPAAKMVKEGVNTGAFQIQLLQKIEELTLYVIEQEKRIKALEVENKVLKTND